MGLDMYAYAAAKGQHSEYWENYDFQNDTSTVIKPRELAYWRKHPNLHGWMEKLWHKKCNAANQTVVEDTDQFSTFNGVELELTWEDLDQLEEAVMNHALPGTTGFFFGDTADAHYKQQDLQFIQQARSEIFCGLRVFYNSSW